MPNTDDRKQIKISPFTMEQIKALMKVKKLTYQYELIEELVGHFLLNGLTQKEKERYDLLMEMATEQEQEEV